MLYSERGISAVGGLPLSTLLASPSNGLHDRVGFKNAILDGAISGWVGWIGWVSGQVCIWVVDRPTQLICISDIYLLSWRWWPLWSGGLLYQWSLRPKKQAGSDFFEKYPCHVHIVREVAKNRTKNGQKPSKKGVFISTSASIPQMFASCIWKEGNCMNYWGKIRWCTFRIGCLHYFQSVQKKNRGKGNAGSPENLRPICLV